MRQALQILVLLACFAASVGCLMLANEIERINPEWRSQLAVVTELGLGSLLYFIITFIHRRFAISIRQFGSFRSVAIGFLYSVLAFSISIAWVISFTKWNYSPHPIGQIVDQLMFQIRPAVIEEVGFRYGLVVFALAFYGRLPALVVGSVPFGILHLLSFVSGDPIYWEYIIGTTIAGLFLTLIFLGYGLTAAVVAHYSWNVLATAFSAILGVPQESIEGGTATLVTLSALSVYLIYTKRNMLFAADCLPLARSQI